MRTLLATAPDAPKALHEFREQLVSIPTNQNRNSPHLRNSCKLGKFGSSDPRAIRPSRRFASNQSRMSLCESEISVAPDESDSKAYLAQVTREVGRSVELLDVSFMRSPIM